MIINGLEDLRKVSPYTQSPAWRSQYTLRIYASLVQTRMVHPDWSLDQAISYMVYEDLMDEIDIVTAVDGHVDTIVRLWFKAKAAAQGALKRL